MTYAAVVINRIFVFEYLLASNRDEFRCHRKQRRSPDWANFEHAILKRVLFNGGTNES